MTENAIPYSALYAAYAAGTLDPGYALLVETQGALRQDVRRAIAMSEAAAGALLEAEVDAPMAANALDRAFASIDALGPVAAPSRTVTPDDADEIGRLPAPLAEAVSRSVAAEGWKSPRRGIRRLRLDMGSDAEIELFRIQPGASVPRHTHGANEYTLVVTGGYSDGTGSYGPGDLSLKGPDDTHTPVGDEGEVCYALIVRDGALRLTGMIGVMQRILGQ